MSVHELTFPDTNSKEYTEARHHYLLQIIFGETIAIDYCKMMASFAPNDDARSFLLQQQIEEDRHLEMLTNYFSNHTRDEEVISPYLKKMDKIMSNAINNHDYISSVFIQNFIVEGLNVSLLEELKHHADSELSELCSIILKDEIKHMDFGVTELRRILKEDKSGTDIKRLIKLQRKILIPSAQLAASLENKSKYLGIPNNEFIKNTVKQHVKRLEEAGMNLPLIDKVYFQITKSILSIL